MTSTTTGLSEADFTQLRVLSAGAMQDILTLIDTAAGSGVISSATEPLDISAGVLSSAWKPTAVTAGAGMFALANDSSGTLSLSLTGTESRSQLKLADTNGVVRDLTSSASGLLTFAGLEYAKDADVTTAFAGVTAELATKSCNQATTQTTIFQSDETASPVALYLSWAGGTAVNQPGYQSIIGNPYLYKTNFSVPSTTLYFAVELMADSGSHAYFALNGASWPNPAIEKSITGLTNQWVLYAWSWVLPASYLNQPATLWGQYKPPHSLGPPFANSGAVRIRNFRMFTQGPASSISNSLTVTGSIVASETVSGTSFVSTSDSRIKVDIQDVKADDAMRVLRTINAKTYQRVDTGDEARIGFVADHWWQHAPPEWGNIATIDYKQGLLQLDYSRIVPVLWTICQQQQDAIDALTAKVAAQENPVP